MGAQKQKDYLPKNEYKSTLGLPTNIEEDPLPFLTR
jgi:hypothetical protein